MALPNIFDSKVTEELVSRIKKLTPDSYPKWGKMSVDQMLAHCNVIYEMNIDNKHPKPNAFLKLIFKLIVKKKVVTELPYPKNGKTAPQLIIKERKNFENEKERLINYIFKAQQLGESHFVKNESHSFGMLTKTEWSNMFYKHLDHHLKQFDV